MSSKKLRIHLYADECFPVPSVIYLKSLGYSITHAYDKNYINKPDAFHFNVSKKLERILITLDRDFLGYENISLKDHPGIIVISAGSTTPPVINNTCRKLFRYIGADYCKASLVRATANKIIKIREGKIISEKLLK